MELEIAMASGEKGVRLANHLKRLRFERGDMSQEELANAVSVSRQTIISIEKGRFVPSTLLALRIARFFGRPVEEIFHIVEDGPAGTGE
ncbi:MAG TPA: helix-turn-helix transcriptional regulator [Bryobacteraceae bacterium]|nr:helix-turn-helix transcriptional regulator [Bryobacteraceae bacterium]HPQ17596.1 helix-turn-helix transcriptional regulator [Bryobacteraceae bacterium]HPU70726.1 helix-turn-helix transcriptional regulator [Bryobacteraceae bacterium]